MISYNHVLLLFKFGEKRWVQKIIDGDLSFSCAGAFIHQAKHTGNVTQGDELEAVFAHLVKSDARIEQMKARLDGDIEIIDDGCYVYLRRRSAKLKPIFCLYGYKVQDALNDSTIDGADKTTIQHNFDRRMFTGFSGALSGQNVLSDGFRFTMLMFRPQPLIDRVITALSQRIPYKINYVNYETMKTDIFFIEPTDSYDELFLKSPNYKYQHEARVCLPYNTLSSIFERYSVPILPYTECDLNQDYFIGHELGVLKLGY